MLYIMKYMIHKLLREGVSNDDNQHTSMWEQWVPNDGISGIKQYIYESTNILHLCIINWCTSYHHYQHHNDHHHHFPPLTEDHHHYHQ